MSVVEIDKKARMTRPKNIGLKKCRALVISEGAFFITIPFSKTPEKDASNWLSANKERKELKVEAEKLAQEDAINRA
jgi:hypothetical protein